MTWWTSVYVASVSLVGKSATHCLTKMLRFSNHAFPSKYSDIHISK